MHHFLHEIIRDAPNQCCAEGATLQRYFLDTRLELFWSWFGFVLDLFWAPVHRRVKDSTLSGFPSGIIR